MLDFLLDPMHFTLVLVALAIATPLAAWVWAKKSPTCRGRALTAAGATGPVVLALWGIHNAVLATVGFDSIASALIVLAVGIATGVGVGLWVKRGRS